jgi:uncharacterized membrane protein (Fun14 family)
LKDEIMDKRIIYLSIGVWILLMLWLKVTGFTLDTATLSTIMLAIFAYLMSLNEKIGRLEGNVDILIQKHR